MKAARALFLLLSAALAAGCATASSTASHAGVAAARRVTASSAPPGTPARQQQAANEAGNLLAQFVPPPGAVRLAKKPTLPSGGGASLIYTTTVHSAGYWRVRGNPAAVLAWEKAHMPRAFSQEDVIIGPPSWNTFYTLPAVPHRFAAREINARFYDVGGGETVIMADAMVAWLPPRPATEVIPASVTVVTIADSPLPGATQATITAAPAVRRLAALVNGLSPSVIGPALCGMGAGLTMTFRAAPGGPPVAVVQGPEGCGSVGLQLNGKNQPDLMVTDKAAYDSTALKIAGLHWKLIP